MSNSAAGLFRKSYFFNSRSIKILKTAIPTRGFSFFLTAFFYLCLNLAGYTQNEQTAVDNFFAGTYYDESGREISRMSVPGKPPAGYRGPKATLTPDAVLISNVPAFDWSFGCAPTAAAMAAGYYDNTGYPDVYAGPTNEGLMPMDNTSWGTVVISGQTMAQCPLSATRQGLDGRVTMGHVDDYWNYYENGDPDPYIVNNWPQHPYDSCTGDYMGSNQFAYGNPDGASTFFLYTDGSPLYDFTLLEPNLRDGCHGIRLFYESRGYQIVENYSQMIMGYNGNTSGFTFDQYMEEIDNGRPVLIHIAGHTMLGFGYDETGQIVYLHDTWDHTMHSMTWAGRYAGRQHFGVTVIRLNSDSPPPVAAFTAVPREVDPGQSVSFTDNSSGSPIAWQWTFEGGNPATSTEQNPVVTYAIPGIYTVTLLATNINGYDTETRNNYISVRHCFSTGECSDYITSVQLEGINNLNNSCGSNGYSDYTLMTASLVPGKEYVISILKDSIIMVDEKCGIWLDWNKDNDFTDQGEFTQIPASENTNLFSGAFTTPINAQADSLFRMRIRVIKTGELMPCGYSGPGETEDYSIHLLKPVISVTPDTLDFGGVIRFDCSEPLPYTVSACNLSSPLFITASPDMYISFYPDQDFSTALSIPPVNDSITETLVYVKFCMNWTTGEYEYIYNSCPGAITQVLTLHGYEVVPLPGNAPVISAADVIAMPDTLVTIPVTVQGFNNVQFGSLCINYNMNVLVFQGIENIHQELDWWLIEGNEYPVSDEIACLSIYLDGNENSRSIPENEKLFDLVFSYTHSGTSIEFDSTGCNWEDTWYHQMNDVPAQDYYTNGSVSPAVKSVCLNVCLESLYNDSQFLMRKVQGDTGDQFPGAIADVVSVRLASMATPYAIIDSTGPIPLLQDGICKFNKPLSFEGEYYILISHRNSIETWSAVPVQFAGDYISYDFTDDITKAFGNNLKLVGDKYCIFTGDANNDEFIDSGDMTLVDNDASVFMTGYISTDLSGDGIVDTGDITILDNNVNSFISSKKP
ncbi:MAG: GEVED domain-containing protein [Bacteroidota bacterium]